MFVHHSLIHSLLMCACVYVSYSHGRLYMYPRLAPVIAVSVSGRSLLRQTPVRVEAFDLEQSFSDQTIGVPIGERKRFFSFFILTVLCISMAESYLEIPKHYGSYDWLGRRKAKHGLNRSPSFIVPIAH